MKNIKELYNEIGDWYKSQDSKKVNYLLQNRGYGEGHKVANFQNSVGWYIEISELNDQCRSYIFGDVILNLEDISKYMVTYLPSKDNIANEIKKIKDEYGEDEYDEEYHGKYDSAGHSSFEGTLEIIGFWENLDKDKILSVAGGATIDDYEIDVDGARDYYMNGDIYPMIFNYINYTLGIDSEKFEDNIYNSCSSGVENIEYYYANDIDSMLLPSVGELDKLYLDKVKSTSRNDIDRFNRSIGDIINNFKDNEIFTDQLEILRGLVI
jgi:hypothetical protein